MTSIIGCANASIIEDGEGYKLTVKFTDGRKTHISQHKTFREAFDKMEKVARSKK